MPTIANIAQRIALIITGGRSTANLVRPIMSDTLNVATAFYSAATDPGAANDNTQNYRPGSIGRNTTSGRYFICRDATVGAAVWDMISAFYSGASDPGASNDSTQDFGPGSIGRNTTTGRYFICRDATVGAAVWDIISAFYSAASDPGSANDNTQGFIPGSFGRNINTGRYFVCVNANTGAAVWDNVNSDFLYSEATFADASTTAIPFKTAYFKATGSGTIDEAIFVLPQPTYVGKTVEIYVGAIVTTGITIVNQSAATQATLDSFGANNIGCIKLVCTDAALQIWKIVSLSYT